MCVGPASLGDIVSSVRSRTLSVPWRYVLLVPRLRRFGARSVTARRNLLLIFVRGALRASWNVSIAIDPFTTSELYGGRVFGMTVLSLL